MNTFGYAPSARILSLGVFNFDASEGNVRCPEFATSWDVLVRNS